ncbi:MAG: 5-formyltetrahydrofolate cyclo-ligase [Proteobacteria bacterium]|nr:5-formyltetrahydrofolate cyclo-ligase [Pseudomonadota bacterium]
MESIKERKRALRKKVLALRDALTSEERVRKSRAIKSLLFQLPEFIQAKTVMFFVSFRSEVLTEEMVREALALGKKVVVPVTDLENHCLILSELKDCDHDLVPGTYGILEPQKEKIKEVRPDELDLIVVPGSVFDEKGRRIGYGGGYYDKLLRCLQGKIPVAALAFELQIVDEVPCNPERDIPVDLIITENRVIRCR